MTTSPSSRLEGDACIVLLGRPLDEPQVSAALSALDLPWRPQVTHERPLDWIRAGGLELGFEDCGVFEAAEEPTPSMPPVLQQMCFYVPRAGGP